MSRTRVAAMFAAAVVAFPLIAVAQVHLSTPAPSSSSSVETELPVAGEATLQARIIAPCCWNQTLDVHESDVARTLRMEIRKRLRAGESADVIEESIVTRYGERVRAVPKGKSLTGMGLWLTVLVLAAGAGVVAVVLRWVKRSRAVEKYAAPVVPAARDALDERLDREMDRLE